MLELKRFNEEDKEMRATLNDVAKAANVSASLVSMHLNGHPLAKRIAEETKRRIDEAVRRLEVEDFPLTVILDAHGGDLYESGR